MLWLQQTLDRQFSTGGPGAAFAAVIEGGIRSEGGRADVKFFDPSNAETLCTGLQYTEDMTKGNPSNERRTGTGRN